MSEVIHAGMSLDGEDGVLGGSMLTKIDAVGSAQFSGSFLSASADPSVSTTAPIQAAQNNFKGLVT